jgi:soluble lytic murein transglycosylase-like protein
VLLISPVWLLNLAVAFFGHSVVFPLSPYFLKEKLSALGSYAAHRPFCLLFDHPEIDPIVAKSETRNRLPRGLLAAVVQVESGGRPHRISSAGAMGPAQLMPSTARRLGVRDPFDTTMAIDAAGRLLADHMARFRNIRLAVAAYNAGPGAVNGRVPQNGQTPAYVAKVMAAYAARRAQARARPALSSTP